MKISKLLVKRVEDSLGLHSTKAERPVPITATLMYSIDDPYDKELADRYWKNPDVVKKRMYEVFDEKGAMGKHLPKEEFIRVLDECGV